MHGRCFDRFLTGTATALVLSLAVPSAWAQSQLSQQAIEAAVPLPEPANVPPPTAADVAPAGDTTGSTVVNLPEPPALPPPTFKDVAAPPAAMPVPAAAPAAPVVAPAAPVVATPAPPATPAPAPVVAANPDQPIMDALRDLISGRLARIIDRKADRTAVEAFYSSRDYAPIWFGTAGTTERGKQAIEHLRHADADGMDPTEYPIPTMQAAGTPVAIAEAEMRLTESVLDYARHAQMGRVHYSRVSADIVYEQSAPAPLDVLSKVAAGKNAAEALDSYQPPHAAYKALRKKLAEARGSKGDGGPQQVARGPVLELATDKKTKQTVLLQDERVPLLREKLGLPAVKDDLFYDKPLADAVAQFQKEKGLPATGKLTNQTVDAFNGKRHERDDIIIMANMERWRWVPRDLGKAHVVLNIPDFSLRVFNGGAQVWTTRVVVGKTGTPTPLLSETMKYITVNPTWNVPPSIVYNEYLPALQQDPTVLKRMGLNLQQRPDGSVHISQPPGEANALGRIRFNFPNKFLVYQHDTPDKHLFAHSKRAYSHGCMRVQDPDKYAEVLLGIALPKEGYTRERIKGMYGRSEIDIRFPAPIPVHITYQTAFVDDAGQLQIRDDLYGRDARLLSALKEDRRQAEIPVARAQPSYGRPSVRLPNGVGNDGYSNGGGQSFFDRLFGNPIQPQPAPQKQRRASRTTTR
jgi:murein L,D-transpeptidase YcbB/YkuD